MKSFWSSKKTTKESAHRPAARMKLARRRRLRLSRGTASRLQRLIRRTSLDELPQLLNVLMGHMSFIGPRPALENQTELLRARDACGANDVRPGLTGWAQINGRDTLSDMEKARLDGEYVRTLGNGRFRGLLMDLRCFFGTFGVVLRSNGFSEGGPHSSESND